MERVRKNVLAVKSFNAADIEELAVKRRRQAARADEQRADAAVFDEKAGIAVCVFVAAEDYRQKFFLFHM